MLRSYLAQGMYGGPFQSFGGAVDIIVVQQADGSFKSSPWCVKFGDLQNALRRSEKIVEISVNDVPATFHMRVDNKGEAYFEMESPDDILALPPPAAASPPPSLGDHPAEQSSSLHNDQLTNPGDHTDRIASQTAEPQRSTLSAVDLRNPSLQTDSPQLDRGLKAPLVPPSAQTAPVERQQQTIGPDHPEYGASKRMPSAASSDTIATEQQSIITFSLRNNVAQNDMEQDASLSRAVTHDEIQVQAARLPSLGTATSDSGLREERGELQGGPCLEVAAMLKDGGTLANSIPAESASDFQMFENISDIQEAISRTVFWHSQDSGSPGKTVLLDLKMVDDNEESQGRERISGNPVMEGTDFLIHGSSDATACTGSTEAQESFNKGLQMMSVSSSVTGGYSSSLVAESMVFASVVSMEERLHKENNNPTGIVVNESEKVMTGDDTCLTMDDLERMHSNHIREAPKESFSHSGPEESSMGRIGVCLDTGATNGPDLSDLKVAEDEEGKSVVNIGDDSGTGMKEPAVSDSASLLGALVHQDMNEPVIAVPGEINHEDDSSTDASRKSETKDRVDEGVSVEAAGSQTADTQAVAVVPSPSWWSLWPLSFRKSRTERSPLPSKEEALLAATNIATQSHITEELLRKNGYARWTPKPKMRTYVPTSEQIASLNLKDGPNRVTFTFSRVLGNTQVDARIYLWKWNTRIVISDVDGTITKSDVLGQVMHLVGRDWSQSGVTRLFSAIKENGYEVLFLSARAISQAYLTRRFLFNLKQDGETLPQGPVFISPDGLVSSLYREVVRRAPHEFKISCLEGIRELFPKDVNPFYAGFGNRDTDEISYLKVGIPKGKIFIINPKGEIVVNHHVDMKSYTSIHALVDDMFPPMSSHELEDFNSWNYWKLPLPDVNDEITVKQNVKSSRGSTKGGAATKR